MAKKIYIDRAIGFRSNRSVNSNLLIMIDIISEYLNTPSIKFDILYLDFRKAFDRVYNDVLLNKLYPIVFFLS